MQLPLQLEVSGFSMSPRLKEVIDGHLVRLSSRYGRLTSCRLTIRKPGEHHRMGQPFLVSLHIALPGQREVNVAPVSHNRDPRHSDLYFAVKDAFRRAIAQLRRHAQILQGKIKSKSAAAIGHVARLDVDRTCGVLAGEEGQELYFHAHSVLGQNFGKLHVGDRVAYHDESGVKGPQASTVRLLSRGHRV